MLSFTLLEIDPALKSISRVFTASNNTRLLARIDTKLKHPTKHAKKTVLLPKQKSI
jgi:hypothetical protein